MPCDLKQVLYSSPVFVEWRLGDHPQALDWRWHVYYCNVSLKHIRNMMVPIKEMKTISVILNGTCFSFFIYLCAICALRYRPSATAANQLELITYWMLQQKLVALCGLDTFWFSWITGIKQKGTFHIHFLKWNTVLNLQNAFFFFFFIKPCVSVSCT